ncbi:helix-turn-helix domain-containing protein [Kalamiella sp. sgz302252]|uniref:helix-turn-helix domain-containing protein n=1 Tax=Pantoea sp. sgz302252 TaxID=3341827 RepID=UPI0036D218AD
MLKISFCSKILTAGKSVSFSRHKLILIKSSVRASVISINNKERLSLESGKQGILLLKSGAIKVISGEIKFTTLDFNRLAKLQVFVDKANGGGKGTEKASWSYLPVPMKKRPGAKELEYWLITQCMHNTPGIENFCAILRSSECYMIVHFLLNESRDNSGRRLQELCQQYGLSSSHFRRLTRKALGNSAKKELREWRLARALLEMYNEENNLTTVAMNHGYSSLSHFSNEVKEVIGVTPKRLKKQQEWSE